MKCRKCKREWQERDRRTERLGVVCSLCQEEEVYRKNKHWLERHLVGKWAVIKGTEIVEIVDTHREAVQFAEQKYGQQGTFSLVKIGA
jgi:hypothetical protein